MAEQSPDTNNRYNITWLNIYQSSDGAIAARKGISTVVGAVFSIIAITSTILYISYSMHVLDNYSQIFLTKNQMRSDVQREQFKITQVSLLNNKLNITVQNTGQLPINITRVWVQNTTTSGWVAKYEVNTPVPPSATVTNIGVNLPLTVLSKNAYDMKLVTDRGNTLEFLVSSASAAPISLQLIVLPSTVPSGFTTTVLLAVTNNMSNNAMLTNLVPSLSITSGGATAIPLSGPQPTKMNTLQNGDSGNFQWTYQIVGNSGSTVTFNATTQNAYPGNFVTSSVTVDAVSFSDQSSTSLLSRGLSALSVSDTELIFHDETYGALNGYEMYSVAPDTTAQIIQLDAVSPIFYTNNDTVTINIPAGQWNATLRYLSAPVPSTFTSTQYPNLIYHFESSSAIDSSGNSETLSASSSPPKWIQGGGVSSTNAFTFNGNNQYFYRVIDSNSNIPGSVASTALWFKTSGQVTTKQVLVRIGDGATKPFYEISISNHKMYFQFTNERNGNGGADAACTGSKTIDDQQWHHLVAEKTGVAGCQLYVDGSPDGSQTTTTPGCNGINCISVTGNWDVGRDPSVNPGQYYFGGTIDDLIHWNSYQLTSAQVTDLYHASYGSNAHSLKFVIDVVNQTGGFINHINTTSISNYPFAFQDSFGTYSTVSASSPTWGTQNFTFNAPTVNLGSNQRIKFQISFNQAAYGNLPMKFDIDNSAISGLSSALQIPTPSQPLPGYYVCNNCRTTDGTVYVYNLGPYSAWVTENSRVTFETFDGKSVYASWVTGFSGFPHSNSADSPVIPAGTSLPITFSLPYTQPGLDPQGNSGAAGQLIPAGNYRMYVFLNGYDQKGNVLLTSQYIGPVKVT